MRAYRFRPTGMGALVSVFVASLAANASPVAGWETNLPPRARGSFPDLRPGRATYLFSWSGLVAGSAEIHFSQGEDAKTILEGHGRSVGLARALWRFDVNYRSVSDAVTLRPQQVHQDERTRGKRVVTDLRFSPEGVTRTRVEADKPINSKAFSAADLYDLQSALLYVRSQPLRDKNVYRLVVYPATAAYLATITVTGHERVEGKTGSHPAIKLDLKLQRIGKQGTLEPYRKLKRATAWVADDDDRLLLRIEGQIFVGTITAELQSVRFD